MTKQGLGTLQKWRLGEEFRAGEHALILTKGLVSMFPPWISAEKEDADQIIIYHIPEHEERSGEHAPVIIKGHG